MDSKSIQHTRLIYILYIVGAFFWPVMLVGVIIAYIEKGKDIEPYILSHLKKQVRTFWIYLIFGVLGVIVWFVLLIAGASLLAAGLDEIGSMFVGGLMLFVVCTPILIAIPLILYVIVSSVRGLLKLDAEEEVP